MDPKSPREKIGWVRLIPMWLANAPSHDFQFGLWYAGAGQRFSRSADLILGVNEPNLFPIVTGSSCGPGQPTLWSIPIQRPEGNVSFLVTAFRRRSFRLRGWFCPVPWVTDKRNPSQIGHPGRQRPGIGSLIGRGFGKKGGEFGRVDRRSGPESSQGKSPGLISNRPKKPISIRGVHPMAAIFGRGKGLVPGLDQMDNLAVPSPRKTKSARLVAFHRGHRTGSPWYRRWPPNDEGGNSIGPGAGIRHSSGRRFPNPGTVRPNEAIFHGSLGTSWIHRPGPRIPMGKAPWPGGGGSGFNLAS